MRRTFLSAFMLNAGIATAVAAGVATAAFSGSPTDSGPTDPAEDLAGRRAALGAKSVGLSNEDLAREHYTLAVWAREHHLPDAANAEFRAVLAADPQHEAAHAALGDVRLGDRWIPFDDAMKAKGLVFRADRWVLREEAEILDLGAKEREFRKEQHAKVGKLLGAYAAGASLPRKLAREALGTVDDKYKLEPMAYALRANSKDVRLLAAQELGRLGNRRALKPLIYRSIHDKEADVRTAAVVAAIAIGDPNLAAPFVKALASDDADTRMNSAVALARISDVRAVRYLLVRLEAYGGGGPRAYSFFGNQLTYIQDFDVEVAQTAFIADPVVGIVQEGIVLDVQVVGTQQISEWVEREVIHGALQQITGVGDVKNEPGAWATWWRANGEEWEQKALAAK